MFKSRPRKYGGFCIMFNYLNTSSPSTLGHNCCSHIDECEQWKHEPGLAQGALKGCGRFADLQMRRGKNTHERQHEIDSDEKIVRRIQIAKDSPWYWIRHDCTPCRFCADVGSILQ